MHRKLNGNGGQPPESICPSRKAFVEESLNIPFFCSCCPDALKKTPHHVDDQSLSLTLTLFSSFNKI